MRLTARAVHGVHVCVHLARAAADAPGRPVPLAALAAHGAVSPSLLDDVLRILRIAGLVRSRRGVEGGWLLTRLADAITVAEVLAAIDGAPVSVDGVAPEELGNDPATAVLWAAMRRSLTSLLDGVTIADLVSGELASCARLVVGAGAATS